VDDLRHRARGCRGNVVHLAARDPLGDLGRRQSPERRGTGRHEVQPIRVGTQA
jgi:hypothetical protein